jgi:hypothetical protein
MNPIAFIDFAELIAQEHRDAASCRSAISRAYYGAFHLASSQLGDIGLSVEYNHGHLRQDYLNSANRTAGHIGLTLEDLGTLRLEADYRLQKQRAENPAVVKECIAGARRVAENLQQLRAEFQDANLRRAFVDAITAYRQKVKRRV